MQSKAVECVFINNVFVFSSRASLFKSSFPKIFFQSAAVSRPVVAKMSGCMLVWLVGVRDEKNKRFIE